MKKGPVPRLRFAEFVNRPEWNTLTLAEISEPIVEKAGDSSMPTVSITAGTGFVLQAAKFGRDISGDQYRNYIVLRNGELAYNKGNSKKFPQGCVCQLSEFEQAAVPNAFISFRFKRDFLADFYKGYFDNNFHGKQLQKFITSGARSNGLLNISAKDFFSIVLPTPVDSAEQQKIAVCLSSLDKLIAAEVEKGEALKAHKRGLMQGLFPTEGETIPRLRFAGFEEEWIETTLEQVADYENGKAHEQHIVADGEFAVVNSKFISTEGRVRKFTNNAFCLATKGDVLMVLSDLPNGKALAKCFLVDVDNTYTVNQRVCRLTSKGTVPPLMLFYLLNRNSYFLAIDDKLTQTHIKKGEVLDCLLLLPSDPQEQEKIAATLSSLDDLIAAQVQKVDVLKEHKRGLMQSLFPSTAKTI